MEYESVPAAVDDGEDDAIEAFWETATHRARLVTFPGYFGPTTLESVRPPAWSFGETPEQADELLDLLLIGEQTSTVTPVSEYDEAGEPLPEQGRLGIVLDGSERPRALVLTREVEVREDDGVPVVVEQFEVLYQE